MSTTATTLTLRRRTTSLTRARRDAAAEVTEVTVVSGIGGTGVTVPEGLQTMFGWQGAIKEVGSDEEEDQEEVKEEKTRRDFYQAYGLDAQVSLLSDLQITGTRLCIY